ncbi:MAG: acetyltransferase [Planctomycetaceae bacterium]|nr:acetyltransferase [Planctomycetaceae bacterium]
MIFGTGGAGRDTEQIVLDINAQQRSYNLLGYLDGNAARHGQAIHGLPILGDLDWLTRYPQTRVVIAVGNPAARRRLVARTVQLGHERFATLVHPHALVGKWVEIGEGSTLYASCVLTVDIRVGRFAWLNVATTLAHDVVTGEFVTLAPAANVSGNVTIGDGCDLGTNCAIKHQLTLGEWSIIGAGAAVVKDIPPNVTAVGVPAKVIQTRPSGWHLA